MADYRTAMKGPIVLALDRELGRLARLARGNPTVIFVENVNVRCRVCGGITVFPVLKNGGVRPTPAPCAHCGADV